MVITKFIANIAAKIVNKRGEQKRAQMMRDNLCLSCGKTKELDTTSELCYDCFCSAVNAGDDERGTPIY